jgi:hypothetical protein
MISVKRNQQLAELAAEVKQNPELKAALQRQDYFAAVCEPFILKLDAFLSNSEHSSTIDKSISC